MGSPQKDFHYGFITKILPLRVRNKKTSIKGSAQKDFHYGFATKRLPQWVHHFH